MTRSQNFAVEHSERRRFRSSVFAWGWRGCAETLAEYVGQYHSAEEPDAVVCDATLTAERCTIEGERSARVELKADGKDQFSEVGSPFRLSFVRDADGKVFRR